VKKKSLIREDGIKNQVGNELSRQLKRDHPLRGMKKSGKRPATKKKSE
jgi:hypothetical protein